MSFILIVDNDQIELGLISSLLRREGYDVREASNPSAALNVLELERDQCSLVLTDFEMKPMNGLQLVNRMVQASPSMRILFMSGYPSAAHAIGGKFGADCLLPKPFTAPELLRKVKKAVHPRVRRVGA